MNPLAANAIQHYDTSNLSTEVDFREGRCRLNRRTRKDFDLPVNQGVVRSGRKQDNDLVGGRHVTNEAGASDNIRAQPHERRRVGRGGDRLKGGDCRKR